MHFLFGELVGVQFMEQLDATLRAHSVLANYYGFGFQGKDFATESTAWKLLINQYRHGCDMTEGQFSLIVSNDWSCV